MTFFHFSKRKVAVVSLITFFLLGGAIFTSVLNDKFSLIESFNLYARKSRSTFAYWASYKLGGNPSLLLANVFQGSDYYLPSDTEMAKSIPVLVYHGIPDEGQGDNPFSSPNFATHMKTLKEAGWNTINLDQFEAFIKGDLKLPKRSFLLTFDDGRKDTFFPSSPVLNDLGFEAVMFAITKSSLSPDSEQSTYYMSEFELKQMEKDSHWEVESHGRDSHAWYNLDTEGTTGHFFSNRLWLPDQERIETEEEFRARITYDLSNAKKDLEKSMGKTITAFAFPFSDYGQDTVNYPGAKDVVLEEVPKFYDMAFYQVGPASGETFNYPGRNTFMMKRIEPGATWDGQFLLNTLEGGVAKDLPYEREYFGNDWSISWGNGEVGDVISLKSKENTTGASAFLNGSWDWSGYVFSADTNWVEGSNIVLSARRYDNQNYFGCNFAKNRVSIKSAVNGSSFNLESVKMDVGEWGDQFRVGIEVSGSDISCLIDGQTVLTGEGVNVRFPNGGVGLEVWDSEEGVANASFDNISISQI